MEITEKVAYLKGLMEGMKIDTETNEGKILSAMVDILEDIGLELEDLGNAQGGLAVIAHPFEHSTDANRLDDVMSRLDGVEIWNSRADRKNKNANAMARELAQKWKKPVTAGSDAHVPEEVGGGVTVLEADELSLSAVKAALLRGAKQVEGRRGRAMCVARSQKTKREKTNAGVKRRVNGMLFTVKCALQDFTTREDGWHVMDR